MSLRAFKMGGFTLLPVILAMSLIAAIAFLLNRDNGMNAGMVASQSDADRARYTAEAGLQAVNTIAQGKNCTGYTDLGTTAFGTGSFTATANPKSGTPVTLTAAATTAEGASAALTRSNVTMHQTPYTITLQPGTTGMDTSIGRSSPTVNNGADPTLSINTGQFVSLVQFDLSAIPAGAIIKSAQFSLYHASGSTDTAGIFTVTRPWIEGTGVAGSGATWNTYDGASLWAAGGGDYDPAAGVTIALPANNALATWDMTARTAAWIAGILPNYGIALVASGGGTNSFASSENATAANRPKLVVTFWPPCGWVPPATGTTVTLTASQDTWIDEAHTASNYGTDISFTVTTNKIGRGLVKFNLSSIPAGAKFTSAKLLLYAGGFSPTNPPTSSILTVNPVNVPWTENGASWKTANGSPNSWKCGCFGGNFAAAAASATLSSSFTPGGWVEWDVTALAQEWFDGVRLNYGVGVLMDPTSGSSVAFNSKDATYAPQYMPQLVLTY